MGPGYWIGWLLGLVLALALVTTFNPHWAICFALGFGLSLAGGIMGQQYLGR